MKRIMLIGPSQCGKTSLTQCMRGEALHYQKTQAIVWSPTTIDTPGEYLENRCLYSDLASPQRISLVESWLVQAGAQQVFVTSALENTGVDEMFIFLNAKEPSCLTK